MRRSEADVNGIPDESLAELLLSKAARAVKEVDRAVHTALEHAHQSHWHPASTAPCNQDLEIRVIEDGMISTLPFPCRHTNRGEWINVDLGMPLHIQLAEWRAWHKAKSPHPHQTSIFDPEESEARRKEQWGGCHEDAKFGTEPFQQFDERLMERAQKSIIQAME